MCWLSTHVPWSDGNTILSLGDGHHFGRGFPARMDDPKPYRFATKDWDPGQCLSISVGVFYCDTLPECSPEDFVSATFPDNTTQGMETVCPRIFVTSALCQILLIHHVMACGWYYLGTMSEDGHGDLKKLSGLIISFVGFE